MTHDELLNEVAHLRGTCSAMLKEIVLLLRPKAGEPLPLAAQPILDAYAEEVISGGRARELLRLWAHGATREEIVSMLPNDEVHHEG